MYRYDQDGNWDLPEVERELAQVIGRSKAIRLSRKIYFNNRHPSKSGGNGRSRAASLYVPNEMNETFARHVGDGQDAEAVLAVFRGQTIFLTGCKGVITRLRDNLIRRHASDGVRHESLAKYSGVGERQVRNICRGIDRPKSPDALRELRPDEAEILRFLRWCWEA